MQSSNIDDPLTSNLRVATFSIAAFDYLQTIPGEIKLYRRQYAQGRMSIVCFLFIVVRYVSIVSLVLNGIGFYSNTFDMESCRKFRLAPPVTKMIAGFASQGLIFLRTWAISRKSRTVLIFLSVICVMTVPMMVIGNVYKRDPFIKQGTQKCIAKQLDETAFNSAPMYYGAMAGFDITACAVATYYLIDRNSGSTMSKFTKKVLQHGMMYAFGTTLVNIVVLLGTSHVKYVEKLGAFFSVAVTMIMAQHLVLATQSIKVPPPALEHIAITDRAHTMYTDTTSLSPHTAKPVHDFTAKLTVVHERDENSSSTAFDPSRRSPIPHFIIDIEQPTPSQPRLLDSRQQSHPSSPVGLAL